MISPADERAIEALAWARDEFVATGRPALARRCHDIMRLVATVTKECSACGERLPLAAFFRDSRLVQGRASQCRRCHVETAVRTRDPENFRALNRDYMRGRRAVA